jgi:electron transfer flavoprotein alpha subunit
MPRVAALLDVMVISDASGVVDADTFERPIYAGNAIQTVKSSDAKKVVTFRTSTFDAAGTGGLRPVETVARPRQSRPVGMGRGQGRESDRPELTSAGIVVSGGRGVGSEETSR